MSSIPTAHVKALSWSELDCWEKDVDDHYKRYILGEVTPPSEAQEFGSIIHRTIEDSQFPWLKELVSKKFDPHKQRIARKLLDGIEKHRPVESEVFLKADLDDIPLLAILDGFDKDNRGLDEYKTSAVDEKSPFAWKQSTVDKHGQLTFYALVYYQLYHQYFKEIRLHRLHTKTGNVKTFYTARGPADLKEIRERIKRCYYELNREGLWTLRKSKKDRENIHIVPITFATAPIGI